MIFRVVLSISVAATWLFQFGCTNATPEVNWLSNTPNVARIENDYLGFKGNSIPRGDDMEITDDVGNKFELRLNHTKGGYQFFAAKTPGLVIKTGIVYSMFVKNSYAGSPIPITFEAPVSGGGSALPSGGVDGQILTVVSGNAVWASLTTGTLAAKNTVGDAEITDISYSKISGLPASFPPSTHGHTIAEVVNLQTELNGKISHISAGDKFSLIPGVSTVGVQAIDLQSTRNVASNIASGNFSLTIGSENKASADNGVAIGSTNQNTSPYGVAIGNSNVTDSQASLAIGTSNSVYGYMGRAFGHANIVNASSDYSTAIGTYNTVNSSNSTTVAYSVTNEFDKSHMIGHSNQYKVWVPAPLVFKPAATTHQNKLFYCDTLVMYSDGSFSKGFVVIQTDAMAVVTIRSSNPRVTFYDATSAPTLSVNNPTATSVSFLSTPAFNKATFECQNMN